MTARSASVQGGTGWYVKGWQLCFDCGEQSDSYDRVVFSMQQLSSEPENAKYLNPFEMHRSHAHPDRELSSEIVLFDTDNVRHAAEKEHNQPESLNESVASSSTAVTPEVTENKDK